MKLNQNDLLKLGAGAAGGYLLSSVLMPHRGFAKHSCGNPNYCTRIPGKGAVSCCNIPGQYMDLCQGECMEGQHNSIWNTGPKLSDIEAKYPQDWAGHSAADLGGNDWRHQVVETFPHDDGGGGGGGGGNPLGDMWNAFVKGLGQFGGYAVPIAVGGIILAVVLVSKR